MPITSTKLAVIILIAAVIIGVVIGIMALLTDKLGTIQLKILSTDAIIAVGCICTLMCAQAIQGTKIGTVFGSIGAVASFITTLLFLKIVWFDARLDAIEITLTFLTIALGCCHIVAMNWFGLIGNYQVFAYASHVVVLAIVGLITSAIWWHVVAELDYFWRLVGCLGIICAAFTLIIPIVSKVTAVAKLT